MTIDEAIKHCEEKAEELEKQVKPYQCESINKKLYEVNKKEWDSCLECASKHRQLVEWLSELQRWREFGDWVVKAVLNDDWEDNADFYAEVLCRKLTKLGKLKLVDNKYMEGNADEWW